MGASTVLLVAAAGLYVASCVLLALDALRAPGLSRAARTGWAVALGNVVITPFTAVLWFAQRRTGRPGRVGSVLLLLAVVVAVGVVFVEALKVF